MADRPTIGSQVWINNDRHHANGQQGIVDQYLTDTVTCIRLSPRTTVFVQNQHLIPVYPDTPRPKLTIVPT